jgi:hypothetical protein
VSAAAAHASSCSIASRVNAARQVDAFLEALPADQR